jgi:hypothetical protein
MGYELLGRGSDKTNRIKEVNPPRGMQGNRYWIGGDQEVSQRGVGVSKRAMEGKFTVQEDGVQRAGEQAGFNNKKVSPSLIHEKKKVKQKENKTKIGNRKDSVCGV